MPDVVVYSTPSCPYCHALKSFLKKNKVDFRDVNVAEDKDAAKEMISATGQMGVPVIKIGDEYVVGFDKKVIVELLHLNP